ncbi:hypothetical protein CAPTEDRAFT_95808 [Capitella teleta]|uniref:Uncharacterized protein n=1 Tax=Capitella teleta TaxID=283909 RepID=R7T787_CAPTE|nr:hypothetical protein CAPTEDRAFT_95808 [Capitella teleta]|eukprot:ELT89455.1 hypothetical protein CAPTEDRAFT_95808 [Capitella teleta]
MSDKKDGDPERWLSVWESESLGAWEADSQVQEMKHQEKEQSTGQELWLSFQNAASNIAGLYKGNSHQDLGLSMWVPFQSAASSVTHMYKGSQDAVRQSYESGSQYGYRKKTRELLAWLKKQRRSHIRRDELIGFLCGKPVVRHQRHSGGLHRASGSPERELSADNRHEPDLRTFRDALALQDLNGAMSNISMGRNRSNSQSESDAQAASGQGTNYNCIILDEMSRRLGSTRKRSSGAGAEQRIDSPNRKRMRLWHDRDDNDHIY